MLCISTHKNSAFRTEELEGVFRTIDDKTHKLTKNILLAFKSGIQITLNCKNLKETQELFNNIIGLIEKDYEFNNIVKLIKKYV